MAKTLTQRIADRVAKEDKATKKNRAIFLALRKEVEEAMKDGWPVKTIWETLHAEGRVAFSYQAFRLYVNKLIAQEGADSPAADHNQAKQPGQVSPAVAAASAPAGTPAAPVPAVSEASGPASTKPSAISGFDFNTKPQPKDLI